MTTNKTINSMILKVVRRLKKGLTVGEIYDRICRDSNTYNLPNYSSVRARVYELAQRGSLEYGPSRKDTETERLAFTFRTGAGDYCKCSCCD